MENNVTLFLHIAGVDQGLHHKAKVMDKGMTRVGFHRNSNLQRFLWMKHMSFTLAFLSIQLFTILVKSIGI